MLTINITPTSDNLADLDLEEDLPPDVKVYDSCDHEAAFFMTLGFGNWIVEFTGETRLQNSTSTGKWHVQKEEDCVLIKKITS